MEGQVGIPDTVGNGSDVYLLSSETDWKRQYHLQEGLHSPLFQPWPAAMEHVDTADPKRYMVSLFLDRSHTWQVITYSTAVPLDSQR